MKMKFIEVTFENLEMVRYNLKLVSPGRPNPNGSVHPDTLNGRDMELYNPDLDMTFNTWIEIMKRNGYKEDHPDMIETRQRIQDVDDYIAELEGLLCNNEEVHGLIKDFTTE